MPRMMPVLSQLDVAKFRSSLRLTFKNGLWHDEWIGTCNQDGHGCMKVGGRTVQATWISYFLKMGDWPSLQLNHINSCHWPACVSFEHLYEGSQSDNNYDMTITRTNPSFRDDVKRKIRLSKVGVPRSMEVKRRISESRVSSGVARGENNPNCRFTDEVISRVSDLYDQLGSQQKVADALGMHQPYVSILLRGKART